MCSSQTPKTKTGFPKGLSTKRSKCQNEISKKRSFVCLRSASYCFWKAAWKGIAFVPSNPVKGQHLIASFDVRSPRKHRLIGHLYFITITSSERRSIMGWRRWRAIHLRSPTREETTAKYSFMKGAPSPSDHGRRLRQRGATDPRGEPQKGSEGSLWHRLGEWRKTNQPSQRKKWRGGKKKEKNGKKKRK